MGVHPVDAMAAAPESYLPTHLQTLPGPTACSPVLLPDMPLPGPAQYGRESYVHPSAPEMYGAPFQSHVYEQVAFQPMGPAYVAAPRYVVADGILRQVYAPPPPPTARQPQQQQQQRSVRWNMQPQSQQYRGGGGRRRRQPQYFSAAPPASECAIMPVAEQGNAEFEAVRSAVALASLVLQLAAAESESAKARDEQLRAEAEAAVEEEEEEEEEEEDTDSSPLRAKAHTAAARNHHAEEEEEEEESMFGRTWSV